MTKQEFLKYVQDHTTSSYYEKKLYCRKDFADHINESHNGDSSPQKIIDFFEGMGSTLFDRVERKSGDVLTVSVFTVSEFTIGRILAVGLAIAAVSVIARHTK